MPTLEFTRNESPTIGVEIELQLVDAETLSLSSSIEKVIAGLPPELADRVKPELMQCYMEINTGVCRTAPSPSPRRARTWPRRSRRSSG